MTLTRTPPVVLLADDDDDLREALADILREEGVYDVVEVGDGLAALDALRTTSFALAILDHRMPGLIGADVVRNARAEGVDVPVLFISAAADLSSLAQDLGVEHYIAKPFGTSQFVATVQRALAGSS